MILSAYNGVECFWPTPLGKGLYGVLDYLGVSLECRHLLVIDHHGFQYRHGKKF